MRVIIGGLGVYESNVASKVAVELMVGTVLSGVFMLIVKSALLLCLLSSVTASCTEPAVAEITVPGTLTRCPFITSQTFCASSGLPLKRMNSLSARLSDFRSGVEATVCAARSAGDGGGGAGVGL